MAELHRRLVPQAGRERKEGIVVNGKPASSFRPDTDFSETLPREASHFAAQSALALPSLGSGPSLYGHVCQLRTQSHSGRCRSLRDNTDHRPSIVHAQTKPGGRIMARAVDSQPPSHQAHREPDQELNEESRRGLGGLSLVPRDPPVASSGRPDQSRRDRRTASGRRRSRPR